MSGYTKTIRGLSWNVHLYNISWFFIGFAILGVANVLANLYLLRLGFSPAQIGRIFGISQLVWAASALPASLLGMRFGMRNVLTAGTAIVGVFYLLFLFVAYLPGNIQITMTTISVGMVYLGAALSLVCGLPYVSSVTSPEERSTALAMNGVMSTGAGVLGNLLAGFLPGWMANLSGVGLEQALPYRLSLITVPLLMIVAAVIQSRMEPDALPEEDTNIGASKAIPLRVFLFFGIIVFLQSASEGGIRTFYNIYLDADLGVPTAAIGTIFGISSLVSVFGAIAMPVLVSKLGAGGAFGFVSVSAAIALVVLGAFPTLAAAAAGFISLGFIYSLAGAVRNVLSQEIVQPYWRSATAGILILGFGLGFAVTALVGGMVISQVRFGGLMLYSAGVAILSAVLMLSYLGLARRKRKPDLVIP
jgi:MFS family permease